jgi:hypothetical protein
MRQALHIFKKDVRHLRLEIAVAISVVAIFTLNEVRHVFWLMRGDTGRTTASGLVVLLLPLVWWMLLGRVIHSEALPGDRQFWITRPYQWQSLLGAKVLFFLAFINIPMLIADLVILRAYGFSIGSELSGLLWSQALLTIVFILPVLALSALTTGFPQLVFAILAPAAIAVGLAVVFTRTRIPLRFVMVVPWFAIGGYAGGYEWVKFSFAILVFCAAVPLILFWQYSRRRTTISRSFAVAAGILAVLGFALISIDASLMIQNWFSKEQVDVSSARVVPDLSNEELPRAFRQWPDSVGVQIPLQVMGLPPGTKVRVDRWTESIQATDGSKWNSGDFSWQNVDGTDQRFIVQTDLNGASYKKLKDGPLKVRGSVYLTLFGNLQSTDVPIGDRHVKVSRVGVCSASDIDEIPNRITYYLVCSSAFRTPDALVSYRFVQPSVGAEKEGSPPWPRGVISYSPFPAEIGLTPESQDYMFRSFAVPMEQAVVETMKPVAHIRLDFEIPDIRFREIRAKMPPNSD